MLSDKQLGKLIWEGNTDKLHELAGCGCCCDEHFFEDCQARRWGGCRGQFSMTWTERKEERDAWQQHYERFHGMTAAQFYGEERA